MADRIITVTDPSVVTNDTLAGYNNYSSIDGQLGTMMTPTEATNGHTVTLSDGATHEVTTKPVGTTNGEFSAVISNAVTVNTSNLAIVQPFAGVTSPFVTDSDWTVVAPADRDQLAFDTSDGLVCSYTTITVIGSGDAYVLSKLAFSNINYCWSADIKTDLAEADSGFFGMGSAISGGSDSGQIRSQAGGVMDAFVKENGTTLLTTGDTVYSDANVAFNSVQIVSNGTTLSIYHWVTDAWVLKQSTPYTISGDSVYFTYIALAGLGPNGPFGKIKNVCVGLAADRWTAQYPSGVTPY